MTKIRLLFFVFLLFFVGILVKLFYLQVLNQDNFTTDYLTTRKISPERGRIFDRNEQPLAINQTTYAMFAEPKKISNRTKVIEDLEQILHLGTSTLEARLNATKDWVRVARNLDKDTRDKIDGLKINAVGFDNEQIRYYPEASLSAQLLGFVGKDDKGDNTGYFGIEGFYDQELTGLPGIMRSERDLVGRPIFVGTQEKVDPENGRDLYLTIDKAVQNIVKKKLVKAMDTYQAKQGCVIIADPMTMQILSLVCLPDFDPTKYYEFSNDTFKNPAISDLYEPGSTFKPLIMAAGIEEKAIKPDEQMNEEGPIEESGYQIRTWNNQYAGRISMTNILEKSSNVGMVYIGKKLGKDNVYDYVKMYGFGENTDIDLQGEASGYIRPKKEWYPIDFSTVTFGQGIAVTPIQMITAFSTVINGGLLMKPYTVFKISDGIDMRERDPKVVRRVISKKTSDILKKMLVSTVEHGEFKWAKPKGYIMGGKTGTAQVAVQGKYDASKTIASFIGFAPVEKPRFIGLVILKEPGSSQWGSETAAPLFFDIAKELLVYYNIPPDKPE